MKKFISVVEMYRIDYDGSYLARLPYFWNNRIFTTEEEFDHDRGSRRYLLRVKIYEL